VPDQFPVMSADNDSRALPVDFFKETHDFKSQFRIQISGRFIGEYDFGIIYHGAGDGDALLFTVRKLGWVIPHFMLQIDHPKRIEYSAADFFSGNTYNLKHHRDVIEYFLVKNQAEVLKDNSHCSPQNINFMIGNTENITAVDDNLTLSGKQLAK